MRALKPENKLPSNVSTSKEQPVKSIDSHHRDLSIDPAIQEREAYRTLKSVQEILLPMKKPEDKSYRHRRDYSRDSSRDARYERSRNHYRRTRHDSSRDSSYYDHRDRRPRQRTPSYDRHHQPTVDRYPSHYPQQMPMNVPYQQAPPSYQNQSYNQNPHFVPVQQQQPPVQQPQQQQFIPQNPNDINAGQHYPPNYQYSGMMTNLNNATCQSWN